MTTPEKFLLKKQEQRDETRVRSIRDFRATQLPTHNIGKLFLWQGTTFFHPLI
jgi:hypothetical protein